MQRQWMTVVWFGMVGLVLAHYPMLFSGFRLIQTDPGDTRFNNYVLEHTYRWLLAMPGHRDFWSPPMFYPARGTLAYGDLLLSFAPLYWFLRALVKEPDTAFQGWMLAVSGLNYVASYLFFRRCFALDVVPSALAALLFSFGSSRIAQLGHQQLLPQVYVISALVAIGMLFRAQAVPSSSRTVVFWMGVFCGSLVLQIYGGFYNAWFLILLLAVGAVAAVFDRKQRDLILSLVRAHLPAIVGLASVSLIATLPAVIGYVGAAQEVGFRKYKAVFELLPPWQAWFYMGRDSLLYGWIAASGLLTVPNGSEHCLGVGLITVLAAAYGLHSARRSPAVRILTVLAGMIIAVTTVLPGGFSLWEIVYRVVPGAQAIRAVSRLGIFLLIPVALGVGLATQRLLKGGHRWATAAVALLCVAEQVHVTPAYDKYAIRADVAQLGQSIDPGCEAFLFTPRDPQRRMPFWRVQLDAMWASLDVGIPTVNGYSGNLPRGWEFYPGLIGSHRDERLFQRNLRAWAERSEIQPDRICWIRHGTTA